MRYLHEMLQVIHLADLPLERCILDGCGYADNVKVGKPQVMVFSWFLKMGPVLGNSEMLIKLTSEQMFAVLLSMNLTHFFRN